MKSNVTLSSSPGRGSISTMKAGSSTNSAADGIFGWYSYIQDFTGSFALDWLREIALDKSLVWDPFAGSGTTLVAAKHLGVPSVGFDMNPFIVDVARAKVDWSLDTDRALSALGRLIDSVSEIRDGEPDQPVPGEWLSYPDLVEREGVGYPADKKLEKWISPSVLGSFQALIRQIEGLDTAIALLFRVALASQMISASNMTFRPNISYMARPTLRFPVVREFEAAATRMINDIREVAGTGDVSANALIGDARSSGPDRADVIFTSPPYPNDMEYVHQSRLELALLGYSQDAKDLSVLKKQMIASSVKLVYRENDWQARSGAKVESVGKIAQQIQETLVGRNWGWNPAEMVAQYFGGMRAVFSNWHNRLADNGLAAVVVGDSSFNGVKVPTDLLLAETAGHHGFACEGIDVFRTRWNSKHTTELRESVVLLRRL